ncbi:hypothetical protein CK501_05760 [Halovibrio salipaludis]|uniref:Uncharacterized protein n=1 Tax=Halovibrio salipaludis TaxID=2032626 RepID=A0A2A2F8S8_9GAMM|nr:hypothetical protein [Halovibrio salipaludis]PAU81067.1 hypothetical protein CK501_05760 [Halovibrio salipaludis]
MSAYVTVPVASEQTGVSRLLIESAIREGEIPAWNCQGEAVVILADVRAYKARILADREANNGES